jgi:hypothetical protein
MWKFRLRPRSLISGNSYIGSSLECGHLLLSTWRAEPQEWNSAYQKTPRIQRVRLRGVHHDGKCSHVTVPLVKQQNACVRSYKPFLLQNTDWRRCSTLVHSPCRTRPSYKQLPPTPSFVHRVDTKPPVFLETIHSSIRVQKYRAPAHQSIGSNSMAKLVAATA